MISALLKRIEVETGLTYSDLFGDVREKALAALARGKVRNEREWRSLRTYVDEIEGDPADAETVEKAIGLLDSFETRVRR